MNTSLRQDADYIVKKAITAVQPDAAVRRALGEMSFPGRVILVSVGKAAWQMAGTACGCLGSRIEKGIVLTKYGHGRGPLPGIICLEAGHPVPDENTLRGTQAVLDMVSGLTERDTVLLLLSGGGSALFEMPLVPLRELMDITGQLMRCGADIGEINTIRKRLSAVKGGRFAITCRPARVETVALSDVLGDRADMIASGPACPDSSTAADARHVIDKYHLRLSREALDLMEKETPKALDNARIRVTGSVRELCRAAAQAAGERGYEAVLLTDSLCCQAREAGSFLASVLRTHCGFGRPTAFIAGGETVVNLTGHGLGGRNQEIALAAAKGIHGLQNAAVIAVGSDGTDGPTHAAGGYADGDTCGEMEAAGLNIDAFLKDNDAYHALEKTGGLVITGPTGTNVNDVAVALAGPKCPLR